MFILIYLCNTSFNKKISIYDKILNFLQLNIMITYLEII